MKMKKKITIALLAMASAILAMTTSCSEPEESTSYSQCLMAKHVKDSTINAN